MVDNTTIWWQVSNTDFDANVSKLLQNTQVPHPPKIYSEEDWSSRTNKYAYDPFPIRLEMQLPDDFDFIGAFREVVDTVTAAALRTRTRWPVTTTFKRRSFPSIPGNCLEQKFHTLLNIPKSLGAFKNSKIMQWFSLFPCHSAWFNLFMDSKIEWNSAKQHGKRHSITLRKSPQKAPGYFWDELDLHILWPRPSLFDVCIFYHARSKTKSKFPARQPVSRVDVDCPRSVFEISPSSERWRTCGTIR